LLSNIIGVTLNIYFKLIKFDINDLSLANGTRACNRRTPKINLN
jgi:hypothetical protein